MSHDEYIVSEAFLDAVEDRVDSRLRELGIDAAAISERGRRIESLERAVVELVAARARLERYEDRARTGWLVLRWIVLGGGGIAAGGWGIGEIISSIARIF